MRLFLLASLLLALTLSLVSLTLAQDIQSPRDSILEEEGETDETTHAKHYIIVFKKDLDNTAMNSFYSRLEDQISQANLLRASTVPSPEPLSITHRYDYSTFRGFSALLDPLMAQGISKDQEIEEVEEDRPMKALKDGGGDY
ncbi:MAG: hypothetical protein DHS80DRAFT_21900 [Piptocephalis tieghemiana]|nr:MAG: hypothetical protein DHS80DRAFT_21900 [Piptocephalis tieghemiana]